MDEERGKILRPPCWSSARSLPDKQGAERYEKASRVQVPIEMPDGSFGAITYSRREFEEVFGEGGADG